MDREEWLKKMRNMAEALYDHGSTAYWVKYGVEIAPTHRQFIEKFLGRLGARSSILDAACGAGLYDGILLEAGHTVLGIDQSSGMLAQARQHYPLEQFPDLRYEKSSLREMNFQANFDGAICIDAVEHICPEDWPLMLDGFQRALKPEGILYMTVDALELGDYRESYERAKAMGLPVLFGEQVDELAEAYAQAMKHDWSKPWPFSGEFLDHSVYHYHPPMQQVRTWFEQAGFVIEEEAIGDEYMHILARKK